MKCPLLTIGWSAARGGDRVYPTDCLKEECAWWDKVNACCTMCHITSIAEVLHHDLVALAKDRKGGDWRWRV